MRRALLVAFTALAALAAQTGPVMGSGAPPFCPSGVATTETGQDLRGDIYCPDPEGDAVTYSVVQPFANGALIFDQATVQRDRITNAIYRPNPGFVGTDTFMGRASDGTSFSNTATITIQVTPVGGNVPDAGKTAQAQVVSGTVKFKAPGSGAFIEVTGSALIPIGSILDVTAGRLRLVTETKGGGRQTGEFYDGIFKLGQKKNDSLVTLNLTGGDFSGCPGGKPASRSAGPAAAGGKGNGLWGEAKGKYKTGGRKSSSTVRGTIWFTQDRCDGTLTKVKKGRVDVRDFVLDKTVELKSGESYLARAKSRRR